jgi:hypothetical protein
MAEATESKSKSKDGANVGDDQPKVPGVDKIEKVLNEGEEKGYIGRSDKPIPNSEFSQETDPTESPSAYDQAVAGLGVEAERRKKRD